MVKKMSLVLFLVAIFSFVGCLESSPNRITSASSSPSVCSQNCLQNSASSIPIVSQQNLGLWVNGTGKATAIPDVAILTLGVESQQKSVKQAQKMMWLMQ